MISYGAEPVYMPELTIYPHAVRIRPLGQLPTRMPSEVSLSNLRGRRKDGKQDGTIKGFSSHAMARLREALAVTVHAEEALCYGVCLTIPWGKPGEDGCPGQEVADEVWRQFSKNLARLVDWLRLGSIFRVELQIRGTTHWHLVVWLPVSLSACEVNARWCKAVRSKAWWRLSCCGSPAPTKRRKDRHGMIDVQDADVSANVRDAHYNALLLLRMEWLRACSIVHDRHPEAAPVRSWEYAFNAIPCRDMCAAYSYLACHSSKHKQEQLGYQGKNWGYIGKKWLKVGQGETIEGYSSNLCKHRRAVGFRLIRKWIERNRSDSLARLVRPRYRVTEDGYKIYSGLSVRNSRYINLFGVPPSVILAALDEGSVSPCRLARGVFHVEQFVKQKVQHSV